MEVKFILLADAANVSREGKLNVTGEFNTIFSVGQPAFWPRMAVVARIEVNLSEGLQHAGQLRVTDADGQTLFDSGPMPIAFGNAGRGIPARADIIMDLVGALLPTFGDYTVSLIVDGVHRGSATLFVRQITGQAPPGALPTGG